MNILIVDDSNDKIAKIVSVISAVSHEISVDTSVDIVSAKSLLKSEKYDLMIVDLLLPVRQNEEVNENGGKNLVNEIQRNNLLKSPTFILGITQYISEVHNFPQLWNVLHYDPSSLEWQKRLLEIINHIRKEKSTRIFEESVKKPTIFVEGNSDKKVLLKAIEIFKPDCLDSIEIKTQKSAGASWVAKQVIIWANSLTEKNGKYLRCVGLLDGDAAGREARVEVNRVVNSSNAGSVTFKLLDLTPTYAREVIELYKKGINIPICLEEMFPYINYKKAVDAGWAEERSSIDDYLKDPTKWDKMNTSLNEHINSLGINEESRIYLMKIKSDHKEDFVNYILQLPEPELMKALKNFETLINETLDYLLED